MSAPKVRLTDVTLRDAHQSLVATRLLTSDMLPVARQLDQAGFWSLETWGGATFDTCIRFLNEDPWDRITRLKSAMPKTPMQMLLRGQNLLGYRHYADDVVEAFVSLAARHGIEVFRIFDALNDTRNLLTSLRAVKRLGKHAQATISYATTPVHTRDAYVNLARELAALGADSICIKDMAGLMKPYDAYELVGALKREIGLPIQVHSHATTGMSVATLVKAVEAGADMIDTAISSMAMGTSHSPAETMVEIFAGTPFETGMDIRLLAEIAAHFREVRRKYGAYESAFHGADTRILVAQVPGGMLSNLERQLKEQGAGDRLDDVLEEIAVVQRDFGYPPLVTPTSQIVGSQAVLNVLFGRYKQLTQESLRLLVGNYGRPPAPPNPQLIQRAMDELRLAEPMTGRPADGIPPELPRLENELKEKLGAAAVSAEDVLTYAMFPQVALTFFQNRHKGPAAIGPAPADSAAGPAAARRSSGAFTVTVDGQAMEVTQDAPKGDGSVRLTVDGQSFSIQIAEKAASAAPSSVSAGPPSAGSVRIEAPMPGMIVRLTREEGAHVADKETVIVMEALKMQMEIKSPKDGRIRYCVRPGDDVRAQATIAEVL